MQNDLIAALERAANLSEHEGRKWGGINDSEYDERTDDAATIRALIADLRAGNLVRREDVVATVHRHLQQWEWRKHGALEDKQKREARDYESMAIACSHLADAIEAAAHEGGGGDA